MSVTCEPNPKSVLLPPGDWYDFYDGVYAGNGEVIRVKPGLDRIPLFVKDGGIIPLMPPVRQTMEAAADVPLEIRHYGKKAGRFVLYDDDGVTFDYKRGMYSLKALEVNQDREGILRGSVSEIKQDGGWRYPDEGMVWVFMSKTL